MVNISNSNVLLAAKAYQQNADLAKTGGMANGDVQGSQSFANIVGNYIEKGTETIRASEQKALQAANGEVGIGELVTAVADAEQALREVVAIRDRIIRAYEDIIRMPI